MWTESENGLAVPPPFFYGDAVSDEAMSKIQRLMTIIIEVKIDPRQRPAALIQKLGIGKSQFYKDKQTLSGMGFEFEYSRTKGRFVVIRDVTLPVENLTLSEQLSLVMALRHLSASGDYILTYHGLNAARKLAVQLPDPLRERLFDDLVIQKGFGCVPEVMDRLQRAITDNWRVLLTYQRPDQGQPSREEVDPYHLLFRRRALYLEGYSWTESGIRVYRLNRIQAVELKSRGFAVREDYDFGRRYRNAFSAFPGETTECVVVRFDRQIRPYIEETMWHHSQMITPEPSGAIRFSVEVAYPREVMWWTFYWGSGSEILAPEWLRAEAGEVTAQMAARYRDSGTESGCE